MGNTNLAASKSFPQDLQIINDYDMSKGFYELRDKQNGSLFVGRKLSSHDEQH